MEEGEITDLPHKRERSSRTNDRHSSRKRVRYDSRERDYHSRSSRSSHRDSRERERRDRYYEEDYDDEYRYRSRRHHDDDRYHSHRHSHRYRDYDRPDDSDNYASSERSSRGERDYRERRGRDRDSSRYQEERDHSSRRERRHSSPREPPRERRAPSPEVAPAPSESAYTETKHEVDAVQLLEQRKREREALAASLSDASPVEEKRTVLGPGPEGSQEEDMDASVPHETEEERIQRLLEERRRQRMAFAAEVSEPREQKQDPVEVEQSPSAPVEQEKIEVAQEEEDDDVEVDLFADEPVILEEENNVPIGWDDTVEEDWDDSEGYLRYRVGEIIKGKYKVNGSHGQGVFSQVLKIEDVTSPDHPVFALKINRNNETMKRAGEMERDLLQLLKDKEKTRNVVLLHDSFEYKKHLCVVLEAMKYNLREVIQSFGGGVGITLTAVRFYSVQLLTGLKHLKQCNILHADIKPDNVVVSEDKKTLKICDFGTASAIDSPENEITPLLVSRFYRPPEIILGLKYDEAVDLWSVGCCIAEMYTGQILFQGKDNNEMLRMHMEIKGSVSKKMIRKGAFSAEYFDDAGYFLNQKEEPGTKRIISQRMRFTNPTVDLMNILAPNPRLLPEGELASVRDLKDLLQRMFVLDPQKRITVDEALKHQFFQKF